MAAETDSNIRAKVWLEPDQVEALRNACYDNEFASYLQQRNDAIIALLYDAGLRVGELVQVDVEMLREGRAELYLPAHIQKDYPNDNSPTAVTIELGSDTSRTLNSYLASRWKDTEALFPSRKADRITEQGVRYMLHGVAEAADVQPWKVDGSRGDAGDVTPHALRHSVAYRMLHEEEGNTLYDVRNRLRHRSLQTTERVYDHFQKV
ncbi:tyrosine-type recombinase/integrase [Natronomonas sp. F2-12]|uniref:Tyrosine-type recombinase/integrase n=1 Tax=Natronomonas aquatica TaxID=2841590 RepID=A0A9R1CWI1_9EURY|nr:tyrosine-type recombinase/integrase [Natronomonas aquatica]MCQ4334884.1 tyrosine-type recombinase/integrase [Natronomonas aquatica]